VNMDQRFLNDFRRDQEAAKRKQEQRIRLYKVIGFVLFVIDILMIVKLQQVGPQQCGNESAQSWTDFFLWGRCHKDFDGRYRKLFKMSAKPPYWLGSLEAMCKPLLFLLLLGFPLFKDFDTEQWNEQVQAKTWGKVSLLKVSVFVALSFYGFYSDLKNLYLVLTAGFSFRQTIGGILIACSFSSNIATYASLRGMTQMYSTVDLSSLDAKEALENSRKRMLAANGRIWICYFDAMRMIYIGPLVFLQLCIAGCAGFLIFPHIIVPLDVFVMQARDCLPYVALAMHRCMGFTKTGQNLGRENAMELELAKNIDANDPTIEFYETTHVHLAGWKKYFEAPLMIAVVIPILVSMLARLIAGDGYVGSILAVSQDMSTGAYFSGYFTTAENALQTANALIR